MKTAMRAGDALKRDTLRMLIAAMKNERIAVGADLSEDQAQAVIRRGVKSRKDSAQQYRDAGRPELADKEDAEIAIREVYLPLMLDEAATEAAVKAGSEIIVLSDHVDGDGNPCRLTADTTYIPPLAATGAVHHHLIWAGRRMQASIVVDTAQCWSTHHFACLIGYGASAVCPYLALESVRHWWHDSRTQKLIETGRIEPVTLNGNQRLPPIGIPRNWPQAFGKHVF